MLRDSSRYTQIEEKRKNYQGLNNHLIQINLINWYSFGPKVIFKHDPGLNNHLICVSSPFKNQVRTHKACSN